LSYKKERKWKTKLMLVIVAIAILSGSLFILRYIIPFRINVSYLIVYKGKKKVKNLP
jgi:hypothetical protein